MSYVDGFLVAVPTAKREAYRTLAAAAAVVFKDHGARHVVEAWGDDVPEGKVTSMARAVKCREDETVVFSWIVWPSKQARTTGMEKAVADPRLDGCDVPFDGQRMIFGGFEAIVDV
jgi:uncharacterized protein YbaA (DUF1428 family)